MLKKTPQSPEGTRERILRTAIAEFSEKGYSGARVLTICRKSRANPRMIYHYFGGKDRLYVAVLEHVRIAGRASAERDLLPVPSAAARADGAARGDRG